MTVDIELLAERNDLEQKVSSSVEDILISRYRSWFDMLSV